MSTEVIVRQQDLGSMHSSPESWYAIHVRSRHEKKVVGEFERRGIVNYLPTITEVRQWSDRRVNIEAPLFSCYAFVNIVSSAEAKVGVLRTPGVLGFVGGNCDGASIPDSEIEQIRTVLARKVPFAAHPFLQAGQRVRVRGGALDGLEGILSRCSGGNRLVISVQTIQRALSITVEGYQIEPVSSPQHDPVI